MRDLECLKRRGASLNLLVVRFDPYTPPFQPLIEAGGAEGDAPAYRLAERAGYKVVSNGDRTSFGPTASPDGLPYGAQLHDRTQWEANWAGAA